METLDEVFGDDPPEPKCIYTHVLVRDLFSHFTCGFHASYTVVIAPHDDLTGMKDQDKRLRQIKDL